MKIPGFRVALQQSDGSLVRARTVDPCVMIIFGATGDLAHRKLFPALYNLTRQQALPDAFAVLGFSRTIPPAPEFRAQLRDSTERFSRTRPLDPKTWTQFAERVDTLAGSLEDDEAYPRLVARLEEIDRHWGTRGNRIFYFATPARAFPTILRKLKAAGLIADPGASTWTRVIIEKPFGHDLASSRELNQLASETLDESQVYRIDHYLGKETVQNILVFRFANAIFEPLWDRRAIDHVQITAAEDIGVEGRGRFYDETGVMRDVVQNHLLQVLALCAMEQPVSFGADDIRDEKSKVFRSLRLLDSSEVARMVIRGQYRGYSEEPGVSPQSQTPTYVATQLFIDSWRWQGVPFYLRAGKKLRKRVTEVSIHFRAIPFCLFGREEVCERVQPNVLVLRIQPDEGISMRFTTKVPGEDLSVAAVTMDFSYARAFDREVQDAYERLLLDCMRGDATLFARRDAVELAWKVVDPILKTWDDVSPEMAGPLAVYEPGSDGPAEADQLLARDARRWRELG